MLDVNKHRLFIEAFVEAALIEWKLDEYSKQDSGGKADIFFFHSV